MLIAFGSNEAIITDSSFSAMLEQRRRNTSGGCATAASSSTAMTGSDITTSTSFDLDNPQLFVTIL